MKYDGQETSITSYLKQLKYYIEKMKDPNNNEIDLMDDYKYESCDCGKPNKFFCEDCKKNICDKCKDTCYYSNNHIKFRNLEDIKNSIKLKIDNIKKILSSYIRLIKKEEGKLNIEIKDDDNNKIINNSLENKEKEDNNYDIFLIFIIISTDYNNYFHYKNIEGFENYCKINYFKNLYVKLGEFKNKKFINLNETYTGPFIKANNLEFIYRYGQNLDKGDWINAESEIYGKYIFENGEYYEGKFKNDLRNGQGILYYKNGNIKYEGEFINDEFEFIWKIYL